LIVVVLTGSYLRWERIVVFLCLLDLAWLFIALGLRPSFSEIAHNTLVPGIPSGGLTASLVFLVVAIVGTTIAPGSCSSSKAASLTSGCALRI